ncbi:MAG: dockerin type I domain-containing protein [bacterium]
MKKYSYAGLVLLLVFCLRSSAMSAALPSGTLLTIDNGFEGAASYFTMAVSSTTILTTYLKSTTTTGVQHPKCLNGGILLGTNQPAGTGSHTGTTVPADNGPIDAPWNFFFNTGNDFQDLAAGGVTDNGNGTLNMVGWRVSWNGIPSINMGMGGGANIFTKSLDGTHYTLDYMTTVPPGDPSGFGGVPYGLHLEGRIVVVDLCADNHCTDSNACTVDLCDSGTGACTNTLDCTLPGCNSTVDPRCDLCNGVVCDDGNACNGVETCDSNTGGCIAGTPLNCDDQNICTDDTCNPAAGCVNAPGSANCPSGNVWVTPATGGEIRFYDWGYTGPGKDGCAEGDPGCTDWRRALEFNPISGFGGPAEGNALDPAGGIGQRQHVITQDQDWLTPDPAHNIVGDFDGGENFPNANMDANVNFYKWGYTTVAGSAFNNMMIDYDGDYLIPKGDMHFVFYDIFRYKDMTGANPDQTFDTRINFQPFPISDAIGWCGSVLTSHPAALEPMAGQVTFDFAFEAYFPFTDLGPNGLPDPGEGSVQIVPGFIMRSYGTLEVDVKESQGGAGNLHFVANAVINNTNPTLGRDASHPYGYPDPAYYNHVSFMGGGVVPGGVWVYPDGIGTHDVRVHPVQGAPGTTPGEVRADGAVWHMNSFAGYPFMLRADAIRYVEYFDAARYGADTDDDAVPDTQDNCIQAANGPKTPDAGGNVQRDTDSDGYGNRCDADLNGDGITNSLDLGLFKLVFMGSDANSDLNGDGIVNSLDLGIVKNLFMLPPGPSGVAP